MSFSLKVKDELAGIIPPARHCQIAEAAALFRMCGQVMTADDGQYLLTARIENPVVAKKFIVLLL